MECSITQMSNNRQSAAAENPRYVQYVYRISSAALNLFMLSYSSDIVGFRLRVVYVFDSRFIAGLLRRIYFQIHIFQVNSDIIERTEKVHSHAAVVLMQVFAG